MRGASVCPLLCGVSERFNFISVHCSFGTAFVDGRMSSSMTIRLMDVACMCILGQLFTKAVQQTPQAARAPSVAPATGPRAHSSTTWASVLASGGHTPPNPVARLSPAAQTNRAPTAARPNLPGAAPRPRLLVTSSGPSEATSSADTPAPAHDPKSKEARKLWFTVVWGVNGHRS